MIKKIYLRREQSGGGGGGCKMIKKEMACRIRSEIFKKKKEKRKKPTIPSSNIHVFSETLLDGETLLIVNLLVKK